MRWSERRTTISALMLGVATACFMPGCRSSETTDPSLEELGTLSASLTGVSQRGVVYELREGVFSITGPTSLEFSSEDFRGQQHVEHRLPVGAYQSFLAPGWRLERVTPNGNVSVEAELVSDNPIAATIQADQTTEIVFRFRVGDDEVDLGSGSLVTSIAVDDSLTDLRVVPLDVSPLQIPSAEPNGAPRPVGALRRGSGEPMEFVENELVVTGVTSAELLDVLSTVGGTLKKTLFVDQDMGDIHLAVLTPGSVDPAAVAGLLQAAALGTLEFSSEAALTTFAAAVLANQSPGVKAGVNFVMHSAAFEDRELQEGPSGPSGYTPNPFDWPMFSQGSRQDIGVAEAWRALDHYDRLDSRVPVVVLDGGFRNVPDLPADVTFLRGTWDQPNPSGCGPGNDCFWHGTDVVATLAGQVGNGMAAAGTGGPVVQPLLAQAPTSDFFEVVHFVGVALAGSVHSRILNMSGGFWIDQWLCDFPLTAPFCGTINVLAAILTGFDNLVIASAGNDGANIGVSAYYVPCEASGVLCVAGMAHDSVLRDPGSNYSFTGSVDLWAPYHTWVGVDPAGDFSVPSVRQIRGTSFSAPFVAGVAALVQAANPSLRANDIRRILIDTAHRGSGAHVAPRWVNAHGAVMEALGETTPPFIRIARPIDGTTRPRRPESIQFLAEVDSVAAGYVVDWTSSIDGPLGSGESLTYVGLSVGTHTITATVSFAGLTHSDQAILDLTNEAPTVEIIAPLAASEHPVENSLFLSGQSFDPNEDTYSLDDAQVYWLIDGAFFGTGHSLTIPGGTLSPGHHSVRFEGNDGELSHFDQHAIVLVESGGDAPPDIMSMLPADGTDLGYADRFVDGRWVLDVTLSAEATHNGVSLPDSAFTWSTTFTHAQTGTVTRTLGTGRTLTAQLEGLCFSVDHDVTLTVTSGGQQTTRTHRYVVHLLC